MRALWIGGGDDEGLDVCAVVVEVLMRELAHLGSLMLVSRRRRKV